MALADSMALVKTTTFLKPAVLECHLDAIDFMDLEFIDLLKEVICRCRCPMNIYSNLFLASTRFFEKFDYYIKPKNF